MVRGEQPNHQAIQRFAPYPAGIIPTREMFREIRCVDRSDEGLHFLAAARPTTSLIVVTSCDEPDLDFHTARVTRIQEVAVSAGILFRVACQFVGRVHLSA